MGQKWQGLVIVPWPSVCSELNVSFSSFPSVPPLQFPIELADLASPELREWRWQRLLETLREASWRDWGLSWVLKGHFEHAEGEEEDVLGCRHKSRGLAMRRAVCFQVAEIRPA